MRMNSYFAGAGFAAALLLSTAPLSAQPIIGGPWSGLYIGGNIGGAFDANKLSFNDLSTAQDLSFRGQNNDTKFIGGVHAGYDFQPGGIMFGVEGDSDFGDNINYLASIRGRVGVPLGPVLIYGTGGAAFEGAHEQFAVNSTAGGVSQFSRRVNKTGWTAGGGVETYIMPAVSVGAEALWYDLGRDTTDLATPAAAGAETFSVADDRKFAVARARVTYHLGW